MAQQNSTLTLPKMPNSDQRFAVGHESSPKNDSSLVLHSDCEYQDAKLELAFLEDKDNEMTAFYVRVADLSNAIKRYENQGFSIAQGSHISIAELKNAGFTMYEGQLYPSTLSKVRFQILRHFQLGSLNDNFIVMDVSTSSEKLFSFDLCPF